jgi:hypothetical protein
MRTVNTFVWLFPSLPTRRPWCDRVTSSLTDSVYSEPAEVQRQLSHYRSMAPANSVAPSSAEVSGDRTLPCEFCDFSSGHWSSVRRHYMNIHGKKVHRCKDCCYFTGLRWEL